MFSDPQSITTSHVGAATCPKVAMGLSDATYTSPDGKTSIKIAHTTSKSRTRRLVRLDTIHTLLEAASGTNKPVVCSVYMVIDFPSAKSFSVTATNQVELAGDLITWLTASTNANLVKVASSEY